MQTNRPNILIIQADQLAAKYLGAYGYPIATTSLLTPMSKSIKSIILSITRSGRRFRSWYTISGTTKR